MTGMSRPATHLDAERAARGMNVLRSASGHQNDALEAPPDWTGRAACVGHDVDYWDPASPTELAAARAICHGCPVREQCLTANITEPYTVVGGLSTPERASLLGVTRAAARRSPHATRSRYIGSSAYPGCRCDACKAAHRSYEQDARRRRGADAHNAQSVRDRPLIQLRAWDDHPPQYARIEFTRPDPWLVARLIPKPQLGEPALEAWQHSGVVIEHVDADRADNAALDLAARLEREGVHGWRLFDTRDRLIHDAGPHAATTPYVPGDTSAGWWTRAGLPWPGQAWTFAHAEILLRTLRGTRQCRTAPSTHGGTRDRASSRETAAHSSSAA